LAARYGRRAVSVCTISDHLLTNESLTSEERESSFGDMVEISLEAAFA
jgi:purine-nucleoside phosphorylase